MKQEKVLVITKTFFVKAVFAYNFQRNIITALMNTINLLFFTKTMQHIRYTTSVLYVTGLWKLLNHKDLIII